MTPYDTGYATINPAEPVGPNPHNISPHTLQWRPETLRLHIGWLEAQLAETPADDHARGRYDALCDLLARVEVVGVFARLGGEWRR